MRNKWIVLLLVACGTPPPPPPPSFTADPISEGAALFARAVPSQTDVKVEVLARKLGPILGYAFTLKYQGLQPVDPDATRPLDGAVYLVKPSDGALAVGATRRGPAAGEQVVDDETVLATGHFRFDGAATLKLEGTSVRRANSDAVVVSIGGGVLR